MPKVAPGKIIEFQYSDPDDGSQSNLKAKSAINQSPNQKTGIDKPINAVYRLALSVHVFFLTAAMMPIGKARAKEAAIEANPSRKV